MHVVHLRASRLRSDACSMRDVHVWAAGLLLAAPQHGSHVPGQARPTTRKRLRQVRQPSQENTMASAFPSFTQFLPSTTTLSQSAAAPASAERKRGLLGRFLDALI